MESNIVELPTTAGAPKPKRPPPPKPVPKGPGAKPAPPAPKRPYHKKRKPKRKTGRAPQAPETPAGASEPSGAVRERTSPQTAQAGLAASHGAVPEHRLPLYARKKLLQQKQASERLTARAALSRALKAEEAARTALKRRREAIDKLQKECWAAPARIEMIEKRLTTAKQAQLDAMISNATAGTPKPDRKLIRSVETDLADAKETAAQAKEALETLKADIGEYEAEVRGTAVAVETAISEILLPFAKAAVAKLKAMTETLAEIKECCAALWSTSDMPSGWEAGGDYVTSRRPLQDVREQAKDALQAVGVIQRHHDPFAAARKLLRDKPDDPLIELDAMTRPERSGKKAEASDAPEARPQGLRRQA